MLKFMDHVKLIQRFITKYKKSENNKKYGALYCADLVITVLAFLRFFFYYWWRG